MNVDLSTITPATNLSDLIVLMDNAPLGDGTATAICIGLLFFGCVFFFAALRENSIFGLLLAFVLVVGAAATPLMNYQGRGDVRTAVCKAAADALIGEQDNHNTYERLKQFRSATCDNDILVAAAMKAPEQKRQILTLLLSKQ